MRIHSETNSNLPLPLCHGPVSLSRNGQNEHRVSQDYLIVDADAMDAETLATLSLPSLIIDTRSKDSFAAISAAIQHRQIDTLHLIAHGRPGQIKLAGHWLTMSDLSEHRALLAQWQVQKIALWCCQTGQDSEFTQLLEYLTGAEVFSTPLFVGNQHCDDVLSLEKHGTILQLQDVVPAPVLASLAFRLGDVSVYFDTGYLGVQGTNTNQAKSIKTFATLNIARVAFVQSDSDGDGLFGGGSQGNDLAGTIRITTTSGTVISLTGALNWRETSGSTIEVLGFIFDAGQQASLTDTSQNTVNIVGGTTANTSSTLGLQALSSTLSFTNGEDRSGNAATSGLLYALNTELSNNPHPSSIALTNTSVYEGNTLVYTVTLTGTTTTSQDFSFALSGTATSGSDYNSTLTFSDGVTRNSDGSINVPQGVSSFTVSISTTDDTASEAIETAILTVGSVSSTGSILDNDYGITLTRNSAQGAVDGNNKLITTEAGGTNTFTLKLDSQPTSDVTITLTGLDNTEGSLSATSLTFTSSNWNTAQTVTITGADDTIVDGDISYTLTATASGGGYNGQTATTGVINQDNDSYGLTLTRNSAQGMVDGNNNLITTEAGGSNTFTLKLNAQPSADVTVSLTGLDNTEGSLSATSFTFTSANWNTAQTVTITGADDVDTDGDISYTLTATANGGGYNGQTATTGVINQDNESYSLILGTVSGHTTEAGGTATFTVKLSSQPTNDVTITVSSSDTTEGSVSQTLTFTSSNWNTDQTVTVTGVDDSLVDGNIAYQARLSASSTDSNYNGKIGSVSITNDDDDSYGLTLTRNSAQGAVDGNNKLITTEAGGSNTFTLKLNAQPSADVTVSLTGLDSTEGSLSATSFTFTSANWNTAQTVTITGADDTIVDGDISYTLTATANGGGYNGQTATTDVINQDNDAYSLILGTVSGNTTEAGGTATFTVKLSSQPANDVTITVSSSDTTEGSVSQTLTFTSSNWNTDQTVTVTGVDDSLIDGNIAYQARLSASSTDSNYNGKTGTVNITNNDDDTYGLTLTRNSTQGAVDGNNKLITTEAGNINTFTLKLNAQPSADVTVTITGLDSTEGSLSATSFTFTSANWNTAQTVTITGVDDSDVDGDISYTLTATANGGGYNGQTATTSVINRDDDTANNGNNNNGNSNNSNNSNSNSNSNNGNGTDENPAPAKEEKVFSADLDPITDTSGGQKITRIIKPEFTISAGNQLSENDIATLTTSDGKTVGSVTVTASNAEHGKVNVPTLPLDDGVYTFIAQVRDAHGNLKGESPVEVTIVTDRDGVAPSVELAAHNGDFNKDGIADWEQNNVAQLPLKSLDHFKAGKSAPESSFGAIMVGNVDAKTKANPVQLNASAQLLDIALIEETVPVPAKYLTASPTLQFSVSAVEAQELTDISPDVAGLQTRVVIDLPEGAQANTYLKLDRLTNTWKEFLDDGNLDTYDDGATLLDTNNDGLIDRIVVTLTDGGPGDEDGIVNGIIVDPGQLAYQEKYIPVYSVLLASGDRYYSTDISEIAKAAKGQGNLFEGVRFDSLKPEDGGRALKVYKNFITGDLYFATDGDPMPYQCYLPETGAGFFAADENRGPGENFHLWLNKSGITQLLTQGEALELGLASKGYRDLGAVFNTTLNSAYTFDPEAYLIANSNRSDIQQFVHDLSSEFSRTSDAGFVESVESRYLQELPELGITGTFTPASASDLNTVFGTAFIA